MKKPMKYKTGHGKGGNTSSVKGGDADSGSMGSNKGATGGLKMASANGGNGTLDKPSTPNHFPDGLA